MKKIFLLILSFAFFILSSQEKIWQRKVPGKNSDFLVDAVSTLDYGFLLGGSSLSNPQNFSKTNSGNYDYMIAKFSEDGELEKLKYFGGDKQDLLSSITKTSDNGYILAGISNSGKSGNKTSGHIGGFDIWIIKLDVAGNIQWEKSLGGLGNEKVSQVIQTSEGGFLIAGSTASEAMNRLPGKSLEENLIQKKGKNHGNTDYWLVKLNNEGKLQWQKSYGGEGEDLLKKAVELDNGDLILAGTSTSGADGNKTTTNKGYRDWWVLRTDKNGEIRWQKTFGNEADEVITGLVYTKDKQLLLGGYFSDIDENTTQNNAEIELRKTDLQGNLIWKQTYSNKKRNILTNLLENKDGSIVLGIYSGIFDKKQKVKGDFFMMKLDKDGEVLWDKKEGTGKKEVLSKIIETRDGGYVMIGTQVGDSKTGDAKADYYMVKFADKDKPEVPKLPLEAIPNPGIDYTQIIIGKDYEKGQLRIYDLSGKLIQRIELNGDRIIPLNIRRLPVGVYLIKVEADDINNHVKVLKAKY